jgi:predicted Zn-ribbon and HTH transcriptional regulator
LISTTISGNTAESLSSPPNAREHLETYLALANESDPMGDGVPDHVEKEFRSYLRCGILAHGFARARCASCGYDFLVAFSCKGRGACPSCNAKSMDETAAHLVHHVIPYFHFHLCVVDGLFHRVEDDTNQDPADPQTSLRFYEATALTHELLEGLQHTVRKRVLRHFRRHGLLEPHDAEDMLTWDHGGGFSLDASVRIEATDRAGLERLIRGHRRGALVLLGRPSPSTDSTWSGEAPTRSSTSCQGPTSPAAPPCVSPPWSSWTAWPRSSPLPASTVTATTAFSPLTLR